MGQSKGLKTHALRDMLTGYKKHIYHPCVIYHILQKKARKIFCFPDLSIKTIANAMVLYYDNSRFSQ
jgi:hypothetical protein